MNSLLRLAVPILPALLLVCAIDDGQVVDEFGQFAAPADQ
jgi:hypothetical protein